MKVLGFAVLAVLMRAEAQAATCESLLTLSLRLDPIGIDQQLTRRGDDRRNAATRSGPTRLPINDDAADPSSRMNDHPRVYVFVRRHSRTHS